MHTEKNSILQEENYRSEYSGTHDMIIRKKIISEEYMYITKIMETKLTHEIFTLPLSNFELLDIKGT